MNKVIQTYAAYSKDNKLRLNSSSGAIFSLLAQKTIGNGGVVYGVTMSADCLYAEYIRVNQYTDLSKIRGSKYMQARARDTYQMVRRDLEAGLEVLFSGTGCQLNGLIKYLGKKYDNLSCVDVICHGVPSPKLWQRYVNYIENDQNSKIVNINFRCKDESWTDFGIKRINTHNKSMFISKDKDPYMLMFLRDYCLRPSCYKCIAKEYKYADLTMADFWGIDEVVAGMNDGKGVSLIITRTEKGQKLFDDIVDNVIYREVSYEEGVRRNRADYTSANRPPERDLFFEDMNKMDFDELKSKYAVPTPIPLKSKIKKIVKKIILMTPARKFVGGYNLKNQDYGMFFTFANK